MGADAKLRQLKEQEEKNNQAQSLRYEKQQDQLNRKKAEYEPKKAAASAVALPKTPETEEERIHSVFSQIFRVALTKEEMATRLVPIVLDSTSLFQF